MGRMELVRRTSTSTSTAGKWKQTKQGKDGNALLSPRDRFARGRWGPCPCSDPSCTSAACNIREGGREGEGEGDTEKARTVVSRRGQRGRWRGSASATAAAAARGCSCWEPVPPAGASPEAEAAAAHRRRRPPRTAPSWEPLAGPGPSLAAWSISPCSSALWLLLKSWPPPPRRRGQEQKPSRAAASKQYGAVNQPSGSSLVLCR